MSMRIGGMSNPFLKTNQVNPFNKSAQVQPKGNEDQTSQVNQTQQTNPSKGLSTEETDEQLKKYSKCMSSYAMAMLSMQGSSKPGTIGVETMGQCG